MELGGVELDDVGDEYAVGNSGDMLVVTLPDTLDVLGMLVDVVRGIVFEVFVPKSVSV